MLEISTIVMAIPSRWRLLQTTDLRKHKERLDFSCAVFDAEGSLVANARTGGPSRVDGPFRGTGFGKTAASSGRDVYALKSLTTAEHI